MHIRGLPCDYHQIIDAAGQRVRDESSYSTLLVYLSGVFSTLPQLHGVYFSRKKPWCLSVVYLPAHDRAVLEHWLEQN